jgi:hypothetical protein
LGSVALDSTDRWAAANLCLQEKALTRVHKLVVIFRSKFPHLGCERRKIDDANGIQSEHHARTLSWIKRQLSCDSILTEAMGMPVQSQIKTMLF